MGSKALAWPRGTLLLLRKCPKPFTSPSWRLQRSLHQYIRQHAYRVDPNNKRGDQYGPLWPPITSTPSDETEGRSGTAREAQGPSKPVKGSLCSGSWKVALKAPHMIAQSPSRFPYADRFEAEGKTASSHQIIEALSLQLYQERTCKFAEVARSRCYSILPVMEESRMDELIGITFERNEGFAFKTGPNTGMQAWWTEGMWGQSVGQQMPWALAPFTASTPALVRPAGSSEATRKHDVTQMLQLWRSRERIKSSRANRTSKGAEKWLDVQEHQHGTAACISYLKDCGYRVLVTQLTPDSVPIHDIDFTQPTAFILGNEVDGASEEAVALADQAVTVPMSPSFTESFNVSVAAALIMSEARRQRTAKLCASSDLSPDEAHVLTAAMLLKQRGSRAVQWHPHWKQPLHHSSPAALAAPEQETRLPCNAM